MSKKVVREANVTMSTSPLHSDGGACALPELLQLASGIVLTAAVESLKRQALRAQALETARRLLERYVKP